jgi:hypothetical protein
MKPLPPNYEVGDKIDCTDGSTAPIIDTIFALSNIVGMAIVASKRNGQNEDQVDSLIISQGIGFITWGASAFYGYRSAIECSDARRDASASSSHHLGVRHRAYGPLPPAAVPFAAPPPAAAPAVAAPAPDVAPSVAPVRQQRDEEKPTTHSPPPKPPWTLPQGGY